MIVHGTIWTHIYGFEYMGHIGYHCFYEDDEGLSPEFQGATWERIRDAAYEGHGV